MLPDRLPPWRNVQLESEICQKKQEFDMFMHGNECLTNYRIGKFKDKRNQGRLSGVVIVAAKICVGVLHLLCPRSVPLPTAYFLFLSLFDVHRGCRFVSLLPALLLNPLPIGSFLNSNRLFWIYHILYTALIRRWDSNILTETNLV